MDTARKEKRSFDKLRTNGSKSVEISKTVLEAMSAAAQAAHPHEACGILLGDGARITQVLHTANVHPNPDTHFEIDPQALIDAHRAARERGADAVLGYFHSHPTGPARPSATDAAMAARDGMIWAILGGGELTFWRDTADGFQGLSYFVGDT